MLEHFKGDEEFVRKVLDYKTQADDYQMMVLTKFLNPHERQIVRQVIGHSLELHEYGGFEGAENQRMIVCPSFYDVDKDAFQITLFEISYNKQFDHIRHKDILGALMNLGLKRDCIGDIDDENCLFACARENADYIAFELTKIKRSPVVLKEINTPVEISHHYDEKQCVVSSLRLDKIIASVYGISRNKASDYIRCGLVKLNYQEIDAVDHLCMSGDMLSLRRHGRATFTVSERRTRQGNYIIDVKIYK